jgi:hypothetical protein
MATEDTTNMEEDFSDAMNTLKLNADAREYITDYFNRQRKIGCHPILTQKQKTRTLTQKDVRQYISSKKRRIVEDGESLDQTE